MDTQGATAVVRGTRLAKVSSRGGRSAARVCATRSADPEVMRVHLSSAIQSPADDASQTFPVGPRPVLRVVGGPTTHWTLDRDGRWFRRPDGRLTSIANRPTLARILAALARRAVEAPGVPLSVAAIVIAVWPETRLVPTVAANRVYVAVSTLRTAGLGAVLRRTRAGYLLDPEVPVRVVAAAGVPAGVETAAERTAGPSPASRGCTPVGQCGGR
jgi:hypothetical protein